MRMGITINFDRKKKPINEGLETRSSWSNPAEWLMNALLGKSDGGFDGEIGDSGLRLAAVYSSVRLISENLAAFPIDLVQKINGERKTILDHPSIKLLKYQPAPSVTSFKWREIMMGQVLTKGDGISRIIRNPATGRPERLKYYPTDMVQIAMVGDLPYYKFNDVETAVHYMDVIHVMAFGDKPNKGVSPITQHAETIGSGLAAQRYNSKYYKNGGWLKGFLKFPGKLDKGRPKELGAEWDSNYGGENSFKTMVLHSGSSFEAANISQRDAQYIETMKFTREEIAGIYNVNPAMIGDTEKMNFSVLEQMDIHFVKYTLRPWIKKWEQELDSKLLTENERANGYGHKFNVNALLRGDINARRDFYATMITHGVFSPNDVRALENENPREGGNDYFNLVNTQTQTQIELAVEKMKLEIEQLKNTKS